MEVTLLTHTPEPERIVASAGRLCYSSSTAAELKERMSDEEIKKLLKVLVAAGHLSTFEHVSFTFGIDGISRACSHQLVRHRLASYSQQSQRYVSFSGKSGFVIPPAFNDNQEALSVFHEAMKSARGAYGKLVEISLRNGLKKETAQEDARFVLPNAAETRIVVTMNARELRHFFHVRCCHRAQWEINALAWEMFFLCQKVVPLLFRKAGPDCLHGRCHEGKMSCGQEYNLSEVKEMQKLKREGCI